MRKQVNLLKKFAAPQALIESFAEVCEINSRLPEDLRSDFPQLLEEQSRKFGFHAYFQTAGSSALTQPQVQTIEQTWPLPRANPRLPQSSRHIAEE